MFADLTPSQKRLIYLGLVELVRSGGGHGFTNRDQGHPVYRQGAAGGGTEERSGNRDLQSEEWGDSPQRNELYDMLSQLTFELGEAADPPVRSWQEFCQLAIEGYERRQREG